MTDDVTSGGLDAPHPVRHRDRPGASRRDALRPILWIGAAATIATAAKLRAPELPAAARSSLGPFLTLGAILIAAALAERVGLFGLAAKSLVPDRVEGAGAIVRVLTLTAVVAALVNLDVAVVVGVPVALRVARRAEISAPWLVVAVAITANAASFLLPTSNVTNLLVLTRDPIPVVRYLGDSWLPWIAVTAITVGASAAWVRGRRPSAGPTAPGDAAPTFGALFDLVPMFLAATGIRALLGPGLVLHGAFLGEVGRGSILASLVDNLPAASAIRAVGGSGLWAAILAMSIGPNLLLTGSVATLISRRLARDAGTDLAAWRFTAMGAAIFPLQITLSFAGLRLVGALR